MLNLAELKQERDSAWIAINKSAPSSVNNDWPRFAQANAAWLKAHVKEFGSEPVPDDIDIESSHYYQKFCRKQAVIKVETIARTDETRNKTNQYRRDHKTSLVK